MVIMKDRSEKEVTGELYWSEARQRSLLALSVVMDMRQRTLVASSRW